MNSTELKKRFPNASQSFLKENADDHRVDGSLPDAKPKRPTKEPLGKAATGEAPIMGSIALGITGYRCRPLDPDGHAGGCKYIIDGLRAAGLLFDDNPWAIRLQTEQVKVRSRKEEKTVIRITYP